MHLGRRRHQRGAAPSSELRSSRSTAAGHPWLLVPTSCGFRRKHAAHTLAYDFQGMLQLSPPPWRTSSPLIPVHAWCYRLIVMAILCSPASGSTQPQTDSARRGVSEVHPLYTRITKATPAWQRRGACSLFKCLQATLLSRGTGKLIPPLPYASPGTGRAMGARPQLSAALGIDCSTCCQAYCWSS